MPTFIDESGSPSRHRDANPYFRLCAAWVSHEQAPRLRAALAEARAALGLRASYEFKYNGTHFHPDRREVFYAAALACGFRFYVSCIDKRVGWWRYAEREEFYYATTMDLAATLRPHYAEQEAVLGRALREPVTVDDNSDPLFLNAVRYAFQGQRSGIDPNARIAQPPKFAKSHVADLLQLADMACGAVGEMLDGGDRWYERIAQAGFGERGRWYNPGVGRWV